MRQPSSKTLSHASKFFAWTSPFSCRHSGLIPPKRLGRTGSAVETVVHVKNSTASSHGFGHFGTRLML
jgi:hypothetical protein